MPSESESHGNTRNRLLDALRLEEYAHITRKLVPVELQLV